MAAILLTLGPVSPQLEVEKALFLNMSGLRSAKGSNDESRGIKKRCLGPFFEEGRHLKIDLVCSLGFCLKILPSFFGPRLFYALMYMKAAARCGGTPSTTLALGSFSQRRGE